MNETATTRRAAESPSLAAAAVTTPSTSVSEVLTAAELPLLPIKALLEEGATSERYAEWYDGTSTELLCLNLVRLTALRGWNQEACPCVNSELLLRRSKAHERVHSLKEQDDLLQQEEAWLVTEVRRHVQADLESGGSLHALRLPQTEALMREALESTSREERLILGRLLREAQGAARRAAVEAEFAAGNYKIASAMRWG